MDLLKTSGTWALKPPRRFGGAEFIAAAAATATIAGFAAALAFLPRPLVLPVVSTGMLVLACLVALVAWRRRGEGRATYWDIAGALTFLGICAALLSEPDQVLPFMENARRAH